MKMLNIIIRLICVVASSVLIVGCTDDTTDTPNVEYGFVQLKISKDEGVASRTTGDRIDSLADAKKVKVTLKSKDAVIEQTLILSAADDTQTERGLWSEKLKLLVGEYQLAGYELLDNVDRTILTAEPQEPTSFTVLAGGLVVQEIGVNVRLRGLARFEMVKDLSQITTRAANKTYRFENVYTADITVRHDHSGNSTTLTGMRTKVEYFYDDSQTGHSCSKIVCDTIVALKAGAYKVTSFIVYNRAKEILEAATKLADNEFIVEDNQTAVAEVPITLLESAGNIKDGITLKKIWEALDGPNWSYRGRNHPKGCNWDFNRDIDLWVAQPGISVLENGRVASLSLSGFAARGDMPEELGDLDELRNLVLGTHDDYFAFSPIDDIDVLDTEAWRQIFKEMAMPDYGLMAMAPEMRSSFPEQQLAKIQASEARGDRRISALDAYANNPDNYSNAITSLPHSIGKLKNLVRIHIANGLIATFPEEMTQLTKCTDVEIYNCRRMTEIPQALIEMPGVQMLYFANNKNISSEKLYEGLKAMTAGPFGKTIQGIYFMNNNLVRVPDLRAMKKLSMFDAQNNKIEEFEAPFGKAHNIGLLSLDNNRLSSLPVDEEGYFAGIEAVETWSFANNQFTELPDIFDATQPFYMGNVSFSNNRISAIEHAAEGTYRGVNVEIFDLSYNRLPAFPKCIYGSNSKINYLIVRGNGMKEFEKEALVGKWTYYTSALDISYNRFTELPVEFNNVTFPYMTGLDMTANAFASFQWRAMNLANLATFIFRGQRDDNGYRCMKEWPVGVYGHHGLKVLYLGSNDIRKVVDYTLDKIRFSLEITDNPNISIDLTTLCPYITSRMVGILCDATQDVRGCDIVKPKN